MILNPRSLKPKLRKDLNLFSDKHGSIWLEFETSNNKIERST